MSNLPKRIFEKLKSLEKKFVSYPINDRLKKHNQKIRDDRENRELVVVDKYGNKYYQYYSHHGLPTRRIVHLNMVSFNKWHDDPIMLGWLERRRINAPTQEELEQEYIKHEEFLRKGLEWDRKEKALIETYRKKRDEALESERNETKALGSGEDFQPGSWNRTQPLVISEESNSIFIFR
jgi:NADH:ubiquinone oxidoreductase subunit